MNIGKKEIDYIMLIDRIYMSGGFRCSGINKLNIYFYNLEENITTVIKNNVAPIVLLPFISNSLIEDMRNRIMEKKHEQSYIQLVSYYITNKFFRIKLPFSINFLTRFFEIFTHTHIQADVYLEDLYKAVIHNNLDILYPRLRMIINSTYKKCKYEQKSFNFTLLLSSYYNYITFPKAKKYVKKYLKKLET